MYGIAAACGKLTTETFPFIALMVRIGKLGAVLVQVVIWFVPQGPNVWASLQGLLAAFSVCMALGGFTALYFVPDVQDGLKNKSLEELSDDIEFVQWPKNSDTDVSV